MKTINKKISIFAVAAVIFGFAACNNDGQDIFINNNDVPSIEVNNVCAFRNAIRTTIADLRTQEHLTLGEIERFVHQRLNTPEVERAIYQRFGTLQHQSSAGISVRSGGISNGALRVINEFDALEAADFPTHVEYSRALENVLARNRAVITELEYAALSVALMVNDDFIGLMLIDEFGDYVVEALFWRPISNWWNRVRDCVVEIVIEAGLGALENASGGWLGVITGAVTSGVDAWRNSDACNPSPAN